MKMLNRQAATAFQVWLEFYDAQLDEAEVFKRILTLTLTLSLTLTLNLTLTLTLIGGPQSIHAPFLRKRPLSRLPHVARCWRSAS